MVHAPWLRASPLHGSKKMDLRKRLIGYLGAMLAMLVTVALGVHGLSLREDIATEIHASEHLTQTLAEISQVEPGLPAEMARVRLQSILAGAPLRHLTITPVGAAAVEHETTATSFARLLALRPEDGTRRSIQLGGQTLVVAPNPRSEIEERFDDSIQLLIILLAFSAATLAVAWRAAHIALSPVRELEAGLHRLASGSADPRLPEFRLLEFRRVAAAIEYLSRALHESRAAQRSLAQQLIALQEAERKHLARELHDEMGQTLTAIGVTAAYLERNAATLDADRIIECARDLRHGVRSSNEQLRGMLRELRPHGLNAMELGAALRELVNSWRQREASIAFTMNLPEQLPEMEENAGLTLYRVIQEALTNVVRHSSATYCQVTVLTEERYLTILVEDDGVGIAPGGTVAGTGLLGMMERVEMVGGNFAIVPGATRGLNLRIALPLAGNQRESHP